MSRIKNLMKKSKFINYKKVSSNLIALFIKTSPYLATKYLYKKNTGMVLNLKNPRDFNEKIQWLKLYWQHPLVAKCGDKYEMRNYAKEIGCSDVLLDSYGIYEHASEINWNQLPQKFVMKVTSGCGFNIICEDKSQLDKEKVEEKLNEWLKVDYSLKAAELHYSKMTPRILCEEFIETRDGILPIDYKVYCFNGAPKFILVTPDRATGFRRFLFDLDWNKVDFEKGQDNSDSETIEKPLSFRNMIYYAEKLAKPFPFVRVDFYDNNGKAVLGEMTFTPGRGMATHYKENMSIKLGDMIELPDKL